MKLIHKALAPLASLEVQKRYIVKGTKDKYLLPEDLLNSAINTLFEQHKRKGTLIKKFNKGAHLKYLFRL